MKSIKDIRDELGIRIEGIQPILCVKNMHVSRSFYKDIPGFEEAERGSDDFTSMNLENAGIYLCKGAQGSPQPGSGLVSTVISSSFMKRLHQKELS